MLQRPCTTARGPRPTASPVPRPTIRIAGGGQNMTHTSRHGGCGASRAAGVIPRRSTASAARRVGVAAAAEPTPSARRGRGMRAVVRERGSASRSREHLGTPDLGAGMRQLRAPNTPRAPGARPRALDRPSPGAASRAEVKPSPRSPESPFRGRPHTVTSKDWTEVEQAGLDGLSSPPGRRPGQRARSPVLLRTS